MTERKTLIAKLFVAGCTLTLIACGNNSGVQTDTTGSGSGTSGVGLGDAGKTSTTSGTNGSSSGTSGTTSGTMQSACGLNSAYCNGACTVTLTDPDNCGSCGNKCAANQVCASGRCASPLDCAPGFVACGQTCTDPLTDSNNCLTCGHVCATGFGCSTGLCVPEVGLTGMSPSCPNGGPPTIITSDAGSTCAGNLAQTTFTWALCSCTEVGDNGLLTTDAFDSLFGPYTDAGGLGAGVGANGEISLNGAFQVSGSFWTDSTSGLSMNGGAEVGEELHDNGNLTAIGVASVGADVYVNGNVTADGLLTIDGTLYVPKSASVSSFLVMDHGQVQGPVTVTPPCDCAASQLIDVASVVAYGATHNDNAVIGLNPDAFAMNNGGLRLDLPCGYYYLSAINSNGVATIAVHGHTAIFVGGDVDPNGGLEITVDPTATMDLFIGGNLTINGATNFGSALVPSQSRIYIAGSSVDINGNVILSGEFYMAYANLQPNGNLGVFGALFTGGYQTNGTTEVHYDTAVLNVGEQECGDGGTSSGGCTSCSDCGNQACNNGVCGACTQNSDCCAPLLCQSGQCVIVFE